MACRLSGFPKVAIIIFLFLIAACESQPIPVNNSSGGPAVGALGVAGVTSANLSGFQNAYSTKIIFNKSSFFSNQEPNAFACAGDARYYYDPLTDRKIPVQPNWLKNVAVDITNSNAINGPSNATACSLSGTGSPIAANCATFDDLMPLNGLPARSILVGGFGCTSGTAGCSASAVLNDIWALNTNATANLNTWAQQASSLPSSGPISNLNGLIWHSGDYDLLHDQFYVFGGAQACTSTDAVVCLVIGNLRFTNNVTEISFNSTGTVSTNPSPANVAPSATVYYGGWTTTNPVASPQPMVGTTFTYGLRRALR